MGIAQLFFKKGNYISTVELDIVITESASATSRMTQNPVENGADVNDHIIIEPMTFFTSGVVSNISSSVIGQIVSVINSFTKESTKAQEAWNALLELRSNRTTFTLVQGLRSYENVVLLSLNENQDKDTANGLFFNATMQELILVGPKIVTSDQFNETDISDKMVQTVAGGQKQLQEDSE